jgi:hypothetical protein
VALDLEREQATGKAQQPAADEGEDHGHHLPLSRAARRRRALATSARLPLSARSVPSGEKPKRTPNMDSQQYI